MSHGIFMSHNKIGKFFLLNNTFLISLIQELYLEIIKKSIICRLKYRNSITKKNRICQKEAFPIKTL